MDYWEESIRQIFDDCEIKATEEQILNVIEGIKGSHENFGMAHGYDIIDSGSKSQAEIELQKLKNEIEKERIWKLSTVPCKECNTTGLVKDGWGRDQTCDRCNGEGRIR